MPGLQEIVDQINSHLEAEPLLRLINYFPEKISRSGSSDNLSAVLKGFCPIHKEKAFRSLIVYEDQRRFACTYLKCPGRTGGNLVELYALSCDLKLMAAAIDLIQRLNLPFDLSIFRDLAQGNGANAVQLMQEEKWEEALAEIEQACSIASEDSGYHRLRAQILRTIGREQEALDAELKVAELFRQQGEIDVAIDLLEGLHAAYPDLYDLARRLASVLEEAGRHEQRVKVLRAFCERLLSAPYSELNFEPFESYLLAAPNDEALRRKVADLYQQNQQLDKAAGHWEVMARAQIAAEQGPVALESIERMEQLSGKNRVSRALKISALRLSGDSIKAGIELRALADEALQEGNLEQAIDFLAQVRAEAPRNIDLILEHASIIEEHLELRGAASLLCEAVKLNCENEQFTEAYALLKKAAEMSPGHPNLHEAAVGVFAKWKSAENAVPIDLARQAFDIQEPGIASAICSETILDPGSTEESRIAAASLLTSHNMEEDALNAIRQYLESCRVKGFVPSDIETIRWACAQWCDETQILEYLAESLRCAGRVEESSDTYESLAARQSDAQNHARAFDACRKALEVSPRRLGLIARLVDYGKQSNQVKETISSLTACMKTLIHDGLNAESIVPLRALLSLKPKKREILQQLADQLRQCGEASEAADCYADLARLKDMADEGRENAWKQSVELAPENADYLRSFIDCLMRNQKKEEALPHYRRLLTLLMPVADSKEIASVFEDILAIAPNDESLRDQHLEWLINSGQTELGIDELLKRKNGLIAQNAEPSRLLVILRRLLEFLPDDPKLARELAQTWQASGNLESAITEYQRASDLWLARNELTESASDLAEVVRIAPEDESAREQLADILLRNNQHEAAAVHFAFLASQCRARNDLANEGTYLEKLLNVRPQDQIAIERFADVCAALGKADRAAAGYETLLKPIANSKDWELLLSIAQRLKTASPRNLAALRSICESLTALGREENAISATLELATIAEEAGDLSTADDCWKRLESLNTDNPEWHVARGKMLERRKDNSAALRQYELAVQQYETLGNDSSAAELCALMMKLGADPVAIRQRTVEYRLRAGEISEATRDLIELVELASKENKTEIADNSVAQLVRISAEDPATAPDIVEFLLSANRLAEAIQISLRATTQLLEAQDINAASHLVEKILSHQPQNPDLIELRIDVLLARKREKQACDELMSLGENLLEKGNATRAEEVFFRIVRIDQNHCMAREALVSCFIRSKRSGKAFSELRNLTRSYLEMGRTEEAISALRRTLQLRSDHQESRIELTEALIRLGHIEEAKSELAIAVRQPAENPQALMQSVNNYLTLKPGDLEAVRWKGDLVAAHQSFESALVIYRQLATALECKAPDQATLLYRDLLVTNADCLDLRREYARFLTRIGDEVAASEQWMALLDSALEQSKTVFAGECAEEARKCDFMPPALRAKASQALSLAGNSDAAAQEALAAAEAYFTEGDEQTAEDLTRQVMDLVPSRVDLLGSAIRILCENKLVESATELSLQAAQRLMDLEQEDDVLEICRITESFGAGDPRLLELQIDALERTGTNTQIVEVCGKLAGLLTGKSVDKAEAAFRRGLSIKDQPELRSGLAKLLESQGRDVEAAEEYRRFAAFWRKGMNAIEARDALEKAIRLNPDLCEAHLELAELHSLTGNIGKSRECRLAAGRLQMETGNSKAAIETYSTILKTHPDDIAVYRMIIDAASKSGDNEQCVTTLHAMANWLNKISASTEAIAVYRQILEFDARDERALTSLAQLYSNLGDVVAAAEMIERLGEIAQDDGDAQRALAFYRHAVAMEPVEHATLGRIAQRLLGLGEQSEAIELLRRQVGILEKIQAFRDGAAALREILKLIPQDQGVRAQLSEMLLKSGEEDEAVEILCSLADEASKTGNLEAAEEIREKIRSVRPMHVENLQALATLYIQLGKNDSAHQLMGQLADAFENSSEFEKAIHSCQMMLDAGFDEYECRHRLAGIYEKAGSVHDAIREYGRVIAIGLENEKLDETALDLLHAISLDPENEFFCEQNLILLKKLGKEDQALAAMLDLAERAFRKKDVAKVKHYIDRMQEFSGIDANSRTRIIDLCDSIDLKEAANRNRIELARYHLSNQMIDEARALCEETISRAEDSTASRLSTAALYSEYNLPDLAVEEYTTIARQYAEQRRFLEAAHIANEGLQIQKENIPLRELAVEACLALDQNEEAYCHCLELAQTAFTAGQLDKAETASRRMIAMRGDDLVPRRILVNVLRASECGRNLGIAVAELARLAEQNGGFDEAVELYSELVEIEPEDLQTLRRLIDILAKQGRQGEASEHCLKLADRLVATGEILEATQVYEQLLAINPQNIFARRQFIQFLLLQGQHTRVISETLELTETLATGGNEQDACRALEKALEVVPKEQTLLKALAQSCCRLRLKGKSIQTYRRLLAEQKIEQKRDEQIQTLEAILGLDPMDFQARNSLIELLRESDRGNEAIEHSIILAEQHFERGMLDVAEQIYREVLNHDCSRLDVWQRLLETHMNIGTADEVAWDRVMLSDLLVRQGKTKDACASLRLAIESLPEGIELRLKHIDVHLQDGAEADLVRDFVELADCFAKNGQTDHAISWYDRALKIRPEMKEVKKRRNALGGEDAASEGEDQPKAVPGTEARQNANQDPQRVELEKMIRAWQAQLRLNGADPRLHSQIAEAEETLGNYDEAYREWDMASSMYLDRGEVDHCIRICQALLLKNPADRKMKRRLTMAQTQKESQGKQKSASDLSRANSHRKSKSRSGL